MSTTIIVAGRKYVALDALIEAVKDRQVTAYAIAMMKIGVEKMHSMEQAMAHALAGYALHVAGEQPQVPFTSEDLATMAATTRRPMLTVASEIIRKPKPGRN